MSRGFGSHDETLDGKALAPYRAQMIQGHARMVQDHARRASLFITDRFKQRLLRACLEGEDHTVESLLTLTHVQVNRPIIDGMTPLHCCAEGGHLKVFQWLLKVGANMTKNRFGQTPLSVAAMHGRNVIVEYLNGSGLIPPEEQAEAFELLGVWHATNSTPHYDYAVHCWCQALELRKKMGLEKHRPPVAAYFNAVEVHEKDDYKMLRDNRDRVHMQALFLCEHILGRSHPKTISGILYFARRFKQQHIYERCVRLGMHALESLVIPQEVVSDNFSYVFSLLAQIFRIIVEWESEARKNNFVEPLVRMLELAAHEMQRYQVALHQHRAKLVLKRVHNLLKDVLYLISVVDRIPVLSQTTTLSLTSVPAISTGPVADLSHIPVSSLSHDPSMSFRLRHALYNLVKTGVRGHGGATLLHMACVEHVYLRSPHVPRITTLSVINFLLEVGADPNICDSEGSTALHVVCSHHGQQDMPVIHALLSAGAHADMRDKKYRLSLLDRLRHSGQIGEVCPVASTTLQCLAARTIADIRRLNPHLYRGQLGQALDQFIDMH